VRPTITDRTILRELARRLADIAALPVQEERRQLWIKHNSLQRVRPLIFVSPEGSWRELVPWDSLRCEGEEARKAEHSLRMRIYAHEHFDHDLPVERSWIVTKVITRSGWGLEPRQIPSPQQHGAWRFDPVILQPSDLKKLRFCEIALDERATAQALADAQELFGDILHVKLKGVAHYSFHLMSQYTRLRGLEEVMLDMYDNPGMLHEAMSFLEEGHRRLLKAHEELGLLSLNNDETYQNSGGLGYTRQLPPPDCDPNRVRPIDMWGSAEAQELAQVSPEQHEEFVLQYERRLLQPFGLTGYGCCENLTHKLDRVFTLPRIRRISISPFADVDACAARLNGQYIFSWKPQPAHLVGDFDEDLIRRYIRHTVKVCKESGCVLEMILKDTHTCDQRPQRFDRWTRIARQCINEAWA
jgi:hypothetical protein